MKRRVVAAVMLIVAVMTALLSGCNPSAAQRAKNRIAEIPVSAENLVLCGDKHVTIRQIDYSLPALAKGLIKGKKPDLYQNSTYYGRHSALYTVVYNRNNQKRETEGCSLALVRFDYFTRKATLLRDMKGIFPVQSYDMAVPSVLQYFDEENGRCVLVRNGMLEIVSTETGKTLFSQQMFGAKDYFKADSAPFARRGADMVCAFYAETVTYYRYTGTGYEVFTFTDEALCELRAGQFDTVDGALYAVKNGETVFAVDILTGNPRDLEEITALVEEERQESERLSAQGVSVEQGGAVYYVKAGDETVDITSDMGATFSVNAAYLREHSAEMREIENIYAEEFPDRTLQFSVSFVVDGNRLFISTDAEIQGYGLVSLYTPVLVFELDLAGNGVLWQGMHGGDRLSGVRFL